MKYSSPQPSLDTLIADIADMRLEIKNLTLGNLVKCPSASSVPSDENADSPATESVTRLGAFQTSLQVAAWNCRGLSQVLPYIQHLAEKNNIIILSEHWLCPYELHKLDDIHPDFTSLGCSACRLNEKCNLTRGCGGAAILWRKKLPLSPVHLDSDRIMAVQLPLQSCNMLTVIGVYLLSSEHPLQTFKEYLTDFEGMISSFQRNGSILVAGDLNARLGRYSGPRVCGERNNQGILLDELIHQTSLHPVYVSSLATGPLCTYFNADHFTTLDYCLIDRMLASATTACSLHEEHPFNLSDHLSLSISLDLQMMSGCKLPCQKLQIN